MSSESPTYKTQVMAAEKKLLAAFASKDLAVLDELIHDDALFVLPNGKTVNKKAVIDNYRSGDMAMTPTSSEELIHVIGDTAVVCMNLALAGTSMGQAVNSVFRYTRVWKLFHDQWKSIAVSGVPL